jgi:exoribonuclease-2
MTSYNGRSARVALADIAHRVMIERGLEPDFSPAALTELAAIRGPAPIGGVRDLRDLLWCSIDNDDSRDLDQLSVAEALPNGSTRILVAIADVASVVKQNTAIDRHAAHNTTSVYTAAKIFPMLPERLSTDLTSLNLNEDRRAVVVEMVFDRAAVMRQSSVFEAAVHNRAKLAYDSVAPWLDGTAPPPAPLAAVPGLEANLRLQNEVAKKLRVLRHQRGALTLETIHARPIFDGAVLRELVAERTNSAKALIADLMIAANGVTAEFLAHRRFPSIRRIVRTPKNWDRIVDLALEHGTRLPPNADGRALSEFLVAQRERDPVHFPDLSLSVVKLIGAGEYVVEKPGETTPGHFGLAAKDYAHSTAPNRRFPDVLTQRLVKAALAGAPVPYGGEELEDLAKHCTEQEDEAKKTERQVGKSAAALLLGPRVGETFTGIVTGAGEKGTWIRVLRPPVEGKLGGDLTRLQVGSRVEAKLVHVDVERGYIDFVALR